MSSLRDKSLAQYSDDGSVTITEYCGASDRDSEAHPIIASIAGKAVPMKEKDTGPPGTKHAPNHLFQVSMLRLSMKVYPACCMSNVLILSCHWATCCRPTSARLYYLTPTRIASSTCRMKLLNLHICFTCR
ncbi:hypothetical protein K431DRAFT_92486 [Polychaeton citri CBS 116435]|uniref:Uncharacterized protein n=1 Tax=Polychaeton citri CBS 116435 TaxID=1314669 RepID=A0A9P4UPY6_9PEZI|nr:hypothetical protein K431DRAFT_92486 [Polychaeton citri CBS 116435]